MLKVYQQVVFVQNTTHIYVYLPKSFVLITTQPHIGSTYLSKYIIILFIWSYGTYLLTNYQFNHIIIIIKRLFLGRSDRQPSSHSKPTIDSIVQRTASKFYLSYVYYCQRNALMHKPAGCSSQGLKCYDLRGI